MHTFNIDGYEIKYTHANATKTAHSAQLYVPKSWHKKKLAVVLLEELE